jgi:hypothetical protein
MTIPSPEITNLKALVALVDGASAGLPWDVGMAIPADTDLSSERDQSLLLGLVNWDDLSAEWQAALAVALGEAELEDARAERARMTRLHALRAEARRSAMLKASEQMRETPDPAALPPDNAAPIDQQLVDRIAKQFRDNRMPAVRHASYLAGFILNPRR